MQDYLPNKQSVVESPKEQTVDELQPEQLIGVLQSVGVSSQYEKRREAAAERKRNSRSEKERRLLKKGEKISCKNIREKSPNKGNAGVTVKKGR